MYQKLKTRQHCPQIQHREEEDERKKTTEQQDQLQMKGVTSFFVCILTIKLLKIVAAANAIVQTKSKRNKNRNNILHFETLAMKEIKEIETYLRRQTSKIGKAK